MPSMFDTGGLSLALIASLNLYNFNKVKSALDRKAMIDSGLAFDPSVAAAISRASARGGAGGVLVDPPVLRLSDPRSPAIGEEEKDPAPDITGRGGGEPPTRRFGFDDPLPPPRPLTDVEAGLRDVPLGDIPTSGSTPGEAGDQPSVRARAASAAASAGELISSGAARTAEVAGNVSEVIRRLTNARNAAIVGSAAVTSVVGAIIGMGGTVKAIKPDGSVVAKFPGKSEDVTIPSAPRPTAAPPQFRPGSMGTGMGMKGAMRKYRTPRRGMWSWSPFVIAANQAAANTGASQTDLGMFAARAIS